MARRIKPHAEQADVDMTPMLDIVFIMLIFFIVTTSFVQSESLLIKRPKATNTPPTSVATAIRVEIRENGTIFMNNRQVDVLRIPASLESLLAENAVSQVIVDADLQASHSDVVAALDQIKMIPGLTSSFFSRVGITHIV